MRLRIDFDGVWDLEIKARIDSTIRACIGEPPANEEWSVLVTSFRDFCTVRVKTAKQIHSKLFPLYASGLSKAIPEWLKQHPLR